jgi:hypothetical protein
MKPTFTIEDLKKAYQDGQQSIDKPFHNWYSENYAGGILIEVTKVYCKQPSAPPVLSNMSYISTYMEKIDNDILDVYEYIPNFVKIPINAFRTGKYIFLKGKS